MEMKLVSRETMKPSTPTLPHLRTYPLSFIDNIVFRNYVPLLFFYSPNPNHDQASIIPTLKKSLSQVLSRYYPLAGTFKDQISIDCNDQGASLLVTNSTCNLSSILRNPTEASLNPLFPDGLQWKPMNASSTILVIQINSFACGGIAISVCMSHKVADAATLSNFINDWATLNRQQQPPPPFPVPAASFFPQENLPLFPEAAFVENDTVCRRLVFEACKIDSLKALVSSYKVDNPTRVEVVSALIYARVVAALGLSPSTTSFRTAVNLRRRTVPPLPENSVGNLVWFLFVFQPREIKVHELVVRMKEGLREFCGTFARKFGGEGRDSRFISECLKQATSVPEAEESGGLVCCASWSGFPMYEADFGWGKPVWFTTSGCPVRNSVVLMDARDGGGVEALVNMEEKDMARFERDDELLRYASINPTLGEW
ncbi:stemmadenine O-acetyltransferase [Cajanus cajan]|uniref:BAHD acyltransferase At5g47980 family n=1 Tax=Cajanus cajan TaxID=3821 RepID=A0A151SE15_CAJCA|nr:stemmadenine O-acetyltransferase [Cajanus cajan]KYP52981.1 BAHD acyltransferase At5g47980 family [Cajanus cajan]